MNNSMCIFKEAFLSALRKHDIEPDSSIIADGRLHRVRDWLDKPGTRNCWYVLFPDFPISGAFGCWRRGIHEIWTAPGSHHYNILLSTRQRVYEALKKDFDKGRELANRMLRDAVRCNGRHQQLMRKKVAAYGIYYYRGALLIPVADVAGQIHGAQRIFPDGSKRFTEGTNKLGNFFLIGDMVGQVICIAEGYSTAATIHAITGHTVAVAFDAGNLVHVAEALKRRYPETRLVICADYDKWTEGNPGMTKAILAAEAVGARVVWPRFTDYRTQGTDFNDLFCEEGEGAVLRCFSEGGCHV